MEATAGIVAYAVNIAPAKSESAAAAPVTPHSHENLAPPEAGNILPDLSEVQEKKSSVMDPAQIDLGERQDGRAKRQRPRRNSGDEE